MDTITLTGVHANGTHGVLAFEHERPQTFVVDVTLHLDLAAAGQSDDLNDTIDYGRVAKDIVAVIEGPHVDLIERLAQRIADKILADGAGRRLHRRHRAQASRAHRRGFCRCIGLHLARACHR